MQEVILDDIMVPFLALKIYESIKNILEAGGGTGIILNHCCEQDLNAEFKFPSLHMNVKQHLHAAVKLILKQQLLRALAPLLAVKVFSSDLG